MGPSAGQTAILILIDNVMGVTHSPRMHEFRKSMYEYLPAKHGQLLRDIDADLALSGTVREAAAKVGEDSELARASADALSSLAAMRAFHLGDGLDAPAFTSPHHPTPHILTWITQPCGPLSPTQPHPAPSRPVTSHPTHKDGPPLSAFTSTILPHT